jgi:hypothetical protein
MNSVVRLLVVLARRRLRPDNIYHGRYQYDNPVLVGQVVPVLRFQ